MLRDHAANLSPYFMASCPYLNFVLPGVALVLMYMYKEKESVKDCLFAHQAELQTKEDWEGLSVVLEITSHYHFLLRNIRAWR